MVVAAVDLVRVRPPVHVEGGVVGEEEAVEAEIRQQGKETLTETHVVETKTPPAAGQRVRVSQVGGVTSRIMPDCSP